jgi:hypothetical protein
MAKLNFGTPFADYESLAEQEIEKKLSSESERARKVLLKTFSLISSEIVKRHNVNLKTLDEKRKYRFMVGVLDPKWFASYAAKESRHWDKVCRMRDELIPIVKKTFKS